jgi:hypothetical protein
MNGKNGSALGVSGDQRVKAMMDSLQRCRRLWCGEEPGIELSLRLLVPKGGHCGWRKRSSHAAAHRPPLRQMAPVQPATRRMRRYVTRPVARSKDSWPPGIDRFPVTTYGGSNVNRFLGIRTTSPHERPRLR